MATADFNIFLQQDKETISENTKILTTEGETDADLNYLYYLKEHIQAEIKKVRRANRKAAKKEAK